MSRKGCTESTEPEICEFCGEFTELRPYGPNDEDICYECGKKDMEMTQKKMDEYLFGKQILIH